MNQINSLAKPRYTFLDYTKCIGIFLICVGHFLESGSFLKVAIYSFHVPLFFVVSGFLCKPCKMSALLKKDFFRIILPYISFYIVSYVYGWVLPDAHPAFWADFFMVDGTTVWNEPLWFLPVMFICHILFVCFLNVIAQKWHIVSVAILTVVCGVGAVITHGIEDFPKILGLDKVIIMLTYLCVGFLLKAIKNKNISLVSTLIFVVFFLVSGFISVGDNISVLYRDYNNIAVYIPLAVVGTVSFVGMLTSAKPMKMVTFISQNTIFYMGTHYFLLRFWEMLFDHDFISDLVGGSISFILITLVCLLHSKLCKKFKLKYLESFGKLFGLYP